MRSPTPKQRSYIYEFKLDQQGNTYFSTGPAAFRYTAQGTLQRIGFSYPTDYIDALYVGSTNRLWVSVANQLVEYDLNRAWTVPSLIFLSVVVNGTHLENNSTATQHLVYDTLGHPTLKENDQVRLRFSLMASKRSHTIRYRLDGYDKKWRARLYACLLLDLNCRGDFDPERGRRKASLCSKPPAHPKKALLIF